MITFWRTVAVAMVLSCAVAGLQAQTTQPVEAPQGTATLPGTQPAAGPASTSTTSAGTSTLPIDQPTSTQPVTPTDDPSVTPPPTASATLPAQANRTSLMIKKGEKELEWRLSYSHFSTSTVFVDGVAMLPVLVIGQVGVERMRKDILISSFALRYGLRDNLEVEVKFPFRFLHDRSAVPDANPPQETTVTGFGLGDIEGAIYYQLPRKSERSIRWIVTGQLKTATGQDLFEIDSDEDVPLGTGFWSSKVGISGVVVSDPAAIFWNVGFTYNWLRKDIRIVSTDPVSGDVTVSYVDVKPGNTIDFGGGFAYALNPRFSINTGVNISMNSATTSNGRELANTTITSATLRMGVVWLTDRQRPIDLSMSIGLTDDSPDFTLEFRQNYKF
ncbi:MAG: outer membrane protein [Armatimonadota bacterium]